MIVAGKINPASLPYISYFIVSLQKASHILRLNFACSVQLGNTRYINLSDGRKLCSECRCTSIMDTETCIPLFREVYRFFEGLNMKIIEDIPIFLVDIDEINKINYKFGGEVRLNCIVFDLITIALL